MFQTNVTGLIAMTQAILPIFLARPDGGRGDIINIGSIAGREPYSGGSIYCATKAAVRSFTDSLRKELIASRVRVIEIDPGQVETEFSIVRFGGDKAKADKVYEGVEPLTGDDIAEVVVFAAGRRENVVVADTLVFPNHQVCFSKYFSVSRILTWLRRRRQFCTGSRRYRYIVSIERKVKERTLIISKFQLLPDINFLLNSRHA
jgi:short-subunit dehydrogenase